MQLAKRHTARLCRRGLATGVEGGAKPSVGGPEPEAEKLGFLRATGGLVGASLGAIAVFGVGVVGVLGAAKAVGSLLGHSLDAKRESAPPAAPTAKPTGA